MSKNTLLNNLLKASAKKLTPTSMMLYSDMDKIEIPRVSTGLPSLDNVLGGGIAEGRIYEIYGGEASAKSTLAIQIATQFQKQHPKKHVGYIDTEFALDLNYAKEIGLDVDKLVFSQPSTLEEALQITDMQAESGAISCVIFDSIAQSPAAKELEGDIGMSEMAIRARVIGQALRRISGKAAASNCAIIFINQTRGSLSLYENETRPGGKALRFAASTIIRTSLKKAKDNKTGAVKFQIKKNKVGKPFGETIITLEFGKGFDVFDDTITFAMQKGAISRNGAFYTFGEDKFQGEEKMRQAFKDNDELQAVLKEVVSNI